MGDRCLLCSSADRGWAEAAPIRRQAFADRHSRSRRQVPRDRAMATAPAAASEAAWHWGTAANKIWSSLRSAWRVGAAMVQHALEGARIVSIVGIASQARIGAMDAPFQDDFGDQDGFVTQIARAPEPFDEFADGQRLAEKS